MNIKIKEFLVDRKGRPKGVILDISEYGKLINLLEDKLDALDLEKVIKTNKGFITEDQLLERLSFCPDAG